MSKPGFNGRSNLDQQEGYDFRRPLSYPLKPRQRENYNFHKVAARLADYGFNCLRLTDDWQGADFIACHLDGETFLKVQLKGRLTVDRKYCGKKIYIAFLDRIDRTNVCFIYPHDKFLDSWMEKRGRPGGKGWEETGRRSWSKTPDWARELLAEYRI